MLFDELIVIRYSPAQLVPAEEMNAEEALGSMALGYGIDVRLKLGVVERRGRDRELCQSGPEVQRLDHLPVDILGGELDDRPFPFSFALHACNSTPRHQSANIDPILALPHAAVAHDIGVAPDAAEEVGANVLELVPTLWNGQLGCRDRRHQTGLALWNRGGCPSATVRRWIRAGRNAYAVRRLFSRGKG